MNPPYIAKNLDELFDNAPDYVQELIHSGEVNKTTAILGKIYNLPVNLYVALSNIISFILIGALNPEDVVMAIEDILHLPPEQALKLAEDLEKSILEKARIEVLKKTDANVVTLAFPKTKSTDDLRKEILDTTERETNKTPEAAETQVPPKSKPELVPGTRSHLLEQLQVLDNIPSDEEVSARLEKIKEQISSIDKKEENTLDNNIPLQNFMFGEKGKEVVEPEPRPSSYSKAPTKYNVDPYREVFEE